MRIELREDFTIGDGWTDDVTFWYPLRTPHGTVLTLMSRDFITCELVRDPDGVWRGRFPALHALPGAWRPPAPGPEWTAPRLVQRVARHAQRIAKQRLRGSSLGALISRNVELRLEPR